MDTLDDKEIKSIWERVKRYIDPEKVQASTREEFVRMIEQQMKSAGEVRKKQGSMRALVAHGFADRLSKVQTVVGDYVGAPPVKAPKAPAPKAKKGLPKQIKAVQGNKYSVRVRGKTRYYSQNTTRITRGTFKGKSSFYVYNTRLKKRVTWGVEK